MAASNNDKTELKKKAEIKLCIWMDGIDQWIDQPCHRLLGPVKARKQ